MRPAETDDNEVHRIAVEEATKIIDAVRNDSPHVFWRGLKRISLYDLRGVSSLIPKLGLAFVFPQRTFGVAKQQSGPFDHLILFPSVWFDRLNKNWVGQSSLHHELVHILMKHEEPDDGHPYHKFGPDYFNHPIEIDAYFHQGIIDAKRAEWTTFDEFRDAFFKSVYRPFWKALTAENRKLIENRLEVFWQKQSGIPQIS